MPIFSDDVTITIDGTDYSTFIDDFSESGGDKEFSNVKCWGRYRKILIGRNPYELTLNFRLENSALDTLFKKTVPFSIVLSGLNSDATTTTVTYNNMLAQLFNVAPEVDNLVAAEVTFSCNALNSSNVDNKVFS